MKPRIGLCIALLAVVACGPTAEVTPLGEARTPKPEGCQLRVFPSKPPDFAVNDIGMVRVKCVTLQPDQYCLDEALRSACKLGADLIYDVKFENYTVGLTTQSPARALNVVAAVRAPDSAKATKECRPACGAGYACADGACIPACTPACAEGKTCGADRVCR